MENRKKKDWYLVVIIIFTILGANLFLTIRYQNQVKTNYFYFSTQTDSLGDGPFLFLALDRDFSNYTVMDRLITIDQSNDREMDGTSTQFKYWQENSSKFIHYIDYAFFSYWNLSETYRFTIHYYGIQSAKFQVVNVSGTLEFHWVENLTRSYF